jgi:hypothetical protein
MASFNSEDPMGVDAISSSNSEDASTDYEMNKFLAQHLK